jgi:hypothetical protein
MVHLQWERPGDRVGPGVALITERREADHDPLLGARHGGEWNPDRFAEELRAEVGMEPGIAADRVHILSGPGMNEQGVNGGPPDVVVREERARRRETATCRFRARFNAAPAAADLPSPAALPAAAATPLAGLRSASGIQVQHARRASENGAGHDLQHPAAGACGHGTEESVETRRIHGHAPWQWHDGERFRCQIPRSIAGQVQSRETTGSPVCMTGSLGLRANAARTHDVAGRHHPDRRPTAGTVCLLQSFVLTTRALELTGTALAGTARHCRRSITDAAFRHLRTEPLRLGS